MTLKHVSGWDMCTLDLGQKVPVIQEEKTNKNKSRKSKMIGSAITAASVILATNIKANATEEEQNQQGENLPAFNPNANNEEIEIAALMNIDDVLGSVNIATNAAFSNNPEGSQTGSANAQQQTSLLEVPITSSPGVSDPSQNTQSIPLSIQDGMIASTSISSGATGSNTPTIIQGVDGEDGRDGADGEDGVDGINGLDGVNGLNGVDGRDGVNGTDGADGTDGVDGIDGQDGADGRSVIILDPSLYGETNILSFLESQDINFNVGPTGFATISLSPDQVDAVTAQLAQLAASQDDDAADEEENDHDNLVITGTDTDDFIVATERGGTVSGLGGNDTLVSNVAADILEGGNGNDTADYSRSTDAVNIDLANSTASGGDAEGDTLRSIENLNGSNNNDILSGNELNNILFGNDGVDTIYGNAGFDRIEGGAGADFIDGGAGSTDLAEYSSSNAAVFVDLLNDTAEGGHAEGDELDNIESLTGSLFSDELFGDNGDNRLGGMHGEDTIFGRGGNDTLLGGNLGDYLDGGSGSDTADYTASLFGVEVSLVTGTGRLGEAEGDLLFNIENLAGSGFDDTLIGDDQVNRLTGRDGDDTLIGNGGNDRFVGGEGADFLDGGEGTRDAADYSAALEAVGVDLENGGFEGEAKGDTFSSIEFVVGSDHHDKIFGDDAINRLDGLDGCDILYGRGGNDTLIGGRGKDTLNGGEGNDVFIFEGQTDDDTIEDFEAGAGRTDRVWLRDSEFDTFEDLQDALTQTDDGALLTHANGTILFENLVTTDFVADDFILA